MNFDRDEDGGDRGQLPAIPWRMLLLIGIVGFIITGIVAYGFHMGIRMASRYSPLVDAAMEIKLEATTAHLWFEEILSGDRQEDVKGVWRHLDQANWYAQAMLEGGKNPEGIFIPLDDTGMRQEIRGVQQKLAKFRDVTRERWTARETSRAGTGIDQRYDALFESFIDQADKVETKLQAVMARDLIKFQYIQVMLLTICVLLFLCIGIGFWGFERKQSTMLLSLSEANEKLHQEMVERERAEEELRKAHDELERRVEERTTELTAANERLKKEIDDRKRAEAALRQREHLNRAVLNSISANIAVLDQEGNIAAVNQGWERFAHDNDAPELALTSVGMNYLEICRQAVGEDAHIAQQALIGIQVVLEGSEPLFMLEYPCHSREDMRWFLLHATPLSRRRDGAVISHLNITERKQAEEALREAHDELEQRVEERTAQLAAANKQLQEKMKELEQIEEALRQSVQELTALHTLGQQVSTTLSLDQMVQAALEGIIGLIAPTLALLFMREGDKLLLQSVQSGAFKFSQKRAQVHRVGQCLCGLAVSEGKAVYSISIHTDPRCTLEECKEAGIQSFAALPLRRGDEIIGVLGLASRTERNFEERAVFLESLASQVAIALQNASLYTEVLQTAEQLKNKVAELMRAEEALKKSEKELRLLSSQLLTVQEDERRRIAVDLHDSIGQYLNVIKLKTGESLRHLDKGMFELAGESCRTMATEIQDVLDEVRRIYMGLRPSLLDDLGILVTIGWFCREFQEMYPGISIEKELSVEERQVPESLKIVIYRLLQEALNNIAKHSKADRVLVTVREKDNTLELAIEDNGRGFDLEEALSMESSRRGLGLGSMRERTGLSGGSFSIETAKGAGTVVQASWQS